MADISLSANVQAINSVVQQFVKLSQSNHFVNRTMIRFNRTNIDSRRIIINYTNVQQQFIAGQAEAKKAIEGTTAAQDKQNKSISYAQELLTAARAKLKDAFSPESVLAGAGRALAGLGALGVAAVHGAMEQDAMKQKFVAKTGDETVGSAMFTIFKQDAQAKGQNVMDAVNGAYSFMSVTHDVEDIKKLNRFSDQLAMFDPTGKGKPEAVSAIQAAIRGDTTGLAKQYNISEGLLKEYNIAALGRAAPGSAESMDTFLEQFDELLERSRMGEAAYSAMLASPAKQAEQLGNRVRNSLSDAGTGALAAIGPMLVTLNEAFQAGAFQPFFDALNISLTLLTFGISGVVNAALWLWDVFMTTLPVVGPILLGIIATFAIYRGILFAVTAAQWIMNAAVTAFRVISLLAAAAQWGFNFAMIANPIGLIIALILGLVAALFGLALSFQPVREIMANTFRAIGDIVVFVAGLIIDTIALIVNTIVDTMNSILDIGNAINKAIGWAFGIEGIVEVKIPNWDASDFKSQVQDGIKGASDAIADGTENFSMENMKEKFGLNGNKESPEDVLERYKPPTLPTNPEPATVGATGSGFSAAPPAPARDTPDLPEENLVMMRDLAERDSIRSFVTMNPTVQVTTGNIMQEVDVNTMIAKIESAMEREIAMSAERAIL